MKLPLDQRPVIDAIAGPNGAEFHFDRLRFLKVGAGIQDEANTQMAQFIAQMNWNAESSLLLKFREVKRNW